MANTTNFGWETPDDTDLVKDGAAAIRTLGSAIDTSLVDLKGGTTGQILSKTSNTDMDFTWITNDVGDITAVTAGTGISGGGTTGAVTITNDMATTIDAKGDLIVGTGADAYARLAVGGTNGHVLQVDSTASTGMKWAAVPAAAPSYTLLNSGGTALTGAATITVSGISSINDLYVVVIGASSANTSSEFTFRINSDTAGNYIVAGGSLTGDSAWTASTPSQLGSTGYTSINFAKMSGNAGSKASGYISLAGCNAAGKKVFQAVGWANTAGSNSQVNYSLGGIWDNSATVSSISILSSSGNFDAGTIYVYGA